MQGLSQMREQALSVALNTSKPQQLRDEACGVIKTCEILIALKGTVDSFYQAMRQEEADGVAISRQDG